MKTKIRYFIPGVVLWAVLLSVPVYQTGCSSVGGGVTLAPGGVYTDPVLATADQAILDAGKSLQAFVVWANANAATLAKWPEVGAIAAQITAQEPGWSKDAYAARDAYRLDAKAYRDAIAAGNANATPPSRAKIDATLAVLTNVLTQALAYRSAHAN